MDFCGSCGRPAGQGHVPGCPYQDPAGPDAQPGPPPASPSGTSRVVTPVLVAVAAGALLLAVFGVSLVLRSNGSENAADLTAATVTATPQATTTVVVTPRASPAKEITPTAAASKTVRSLPSGSWLTVLNSLPQAEKSEAEAQAEADALTSGSAQVVVVDSSAIPGLNGGYWAVSMVGFSNNDEARAACGRVGRSPGSTCYSRQVQ